MLANFQSSFTVKAKEMQMIMKEINDNKIAQDNKSFSSVSFTSSQKLDLAEKKLIESNQKKKKRNELKAKCRKVLNMK